MSSASLVVVTGVSGFLGSHIVHQLLEDGYRVRGVARSGKVASVRAAYEQYGEKWEVVAIDNLDTDDFTVALEGASAVIHAAAALPGKATPEAGLIGAVEGSLNIFRQAVKLGIKNLSYCSTVFTSATIGEILSKSSITDKDWISATREEALNPKKGVFSIYEMQKTLAEGAVWEFAQEHPEVEIASVNPPFFYGPFAPGFRNDEAKRPALSTNSMVLDLLRKDGPPLHPAYIDVRDVARALILALRAPPTAIVGRKRLLISGEWFSAQDAVEHLAEVRPELINRLSDVAKTAGRAPTSNIDVTRAKEILGIKFTPWKESVVDAVDSLLKFEKEWESKGVKLN